MLVTSSPNKTLDKLQGIYLSRTGKGAPEYSRLVETLTSESKFSEFLRCVGFLVQLGDFKEALKYLNQRVLKTRNNPQLNDARRIELPSIVKLAIEVLEESANQKERRSAVHSSICLNSRFARGS
jgi:hypothetical protein